MSEGPVLAGGAGHPRGGGSFLLAPGDSVAAFTPEDLTDDQRAIGRLVDEFWTREIEPALPALHRHEPGVGRALLSRAAELGLASLHIPELFGGQDLDLPSIMVAAEHLADDASYSGWHMGHAGIGTLPIVWFGTEAQQQQYLPRLATAELMAAYALTEPHAGTDALALRTRADLAPDGRRYLLNGQKMWITGGGVADLFVVFAKVGGEALTAFIVERAFGVRHGAEEHKMGLAGTSTTALYFDDVPVPTENVLGEIGQGHRIAFSVLNAGRLSMGPLAIRGASKILQTSAAYATNRRTFGRPIAEFGAIREMLADGAVRLFAIESAIWRATGLIEAERLRLVETGHPPHRAAAEAFDESAAECAIVKVAASEMLDRVADHGVQIHGGYGYHRDYFVERAYRDARINRIFEGTNEINRLLIPSLVLKRTARSGRAAGRAALDAFARLGESAASRPKKPGFSGNPVSSARTLALVMLGAGLARYGDDLRAQQEITTRIADAMIDVFVMESAVARATRLTGAPMASDNRGADAAALARASATVYAGDALARVLRGAEEVLMATLGGTEARAAVSAVRALAATEPADIIGLREQIAQAVLER